MAEEPSAGQETGERHSWRTAALCAAAAFAAVLLRNPQWGDDVVVLVVFVLLTGGGRRAALALAAILAFAVTFSRFEWPLYAICLVPLVWLWRESDLTDGRWLREAFGVGFAMGWLALPFVRGDFPTHGIAIQGLASALFGVQYVFIAAAMRWTRTRSLLFSVPFVALIATSCEIVRMVLLGWPLLALGAPAAPTPLAQLASFAGPFSVSFLLYALNLLWLPRGVREARDRAAIPAARVLVRAALPPGCGLVLAGLAWFTGEWIAARVPVAPIPLTVLLVQPNRVVGVPADRGGSPSDSVAALLDQLTRQALERGDSCDLIVWPESVLGRIPPPQSGPEPFASSPQNSAPASSARLWTLIRDLRIPVLVGANLALDDGRRFNSAILVTPEGHVERYDKRTLVIGAEDHFTPGGAYHPLPFSSRDGRTLRLGVSICFEMHFPWLPQYRAVNRPDVMIHLNNESMYREYPTQHIHGTWACRYRAIETRTWQLVCASWTRTAVIDPRGRVRALLDAAPGSVWVASSAETGRGDGPSKP